VAILETLGTKKFTEPVGRTSLVDAAGGQAALTHPSLPSLPPFPALFSEGPGYNPGKILKSHMRLGEFWSIFDTESAPLLARFAVRQFLLMALIEHH
jgi:hypothetical protein